MIVVVNVVPSPFVYVVVASTTEAVTSKEPVSNVEPGMLISKVLASPLVKVIFLVPLSKDAVSNKEPVATVASGMLFVYVVPSTFVNVKSLLLLSKDEVTKYEPESSFIKTESIISLLKSLNFSGVIN